MGVFVVVYEFLTSNVYIHALAIFALALLIARFLLFFFKHVVERMASRTRTKMDDRIIVRMETPIIMVIILVGIQLALRKIVTSTELFENTITSIIIFVISYMFMGVTNIIIDYWRATKKNLKTDEFHEEIVPLVRSLVKILYVLIAVMLVLQLWGVQVGTLLASIGVIGVILGFAFQDTMKNIFGGIALISDGSLHKHDLIELDDGQIGEVVEMTLRSTKIKTFDNDYLMIPNGTLANSRFINYAQPTPTLRITVPVAVAYGSDVRQVKKILLDVLHGRDDVLKFPRREARFLGMGDFSLNFDLLFFIKDYKNKFIMKDQIATEVYEALQRNGIEIPFPTRTLFMDKHKPPKPAKKLLLKETSVVQKSTRKASSSKKKTTRKTTRKKKR